jgi:hypothetical protein
LLHKLGWPSMSLPASPCMRNPQSMQAIAPGKSGALQLGQTAGGEAFGTVGRRIPEGAVGRGGGVTGFNGDDDGDVDFGGLGGSTTAGLTAA